MLKTPRLSSSFTPVPGPKPVLFGLPALMRRNPTDFLWALARDYGDVARFRFGPFEAYLLSHPDLIQDVLVTNARFFMKGQGLQRAKRVIGEGLLTSEGPYHLQNRRLIQPVFLKNRIQNYAAAMGRQAQKMASRWEEGESVNITREMSRLTLAVVGETLFSADVDGEARELGTALDQSLELFNSVNLPLGPLLDLIPFGPSKTVREARHRLDSTIYRLIEERKQSAVDNGDLLSLLLAARYEDGGSMSETQLRDEAMTIFLAGHETTANALAWTFILLAQHPEVAEKLRAEAQGVLGHRTATHNDMEKLVYTRYVVSESFRLYPPAWIIGRKALQDYEIEHQGARYFIPKNSLVLPSQWVMHRHPRYWDEPEEFRPQRWEGENNRPRFAYFPFGAGPRHCIGEGFAWMEAILLLATLAAKWRFTLVEDKQIGLQPRITLRPAGEVKMRVEKWG